MNCRFLLVFILSLFGSFSSRAALPGPDTLEVKVYFRQGSSTLDPSLNGNGQRLEAFIRRVAGLRRDTLCRIHSVRIMAFSSPEGGSGRNVWLSEKRAGQLADFLRCSTDLPDSLFELVPSGVDWDGLAAQVEASSMPYRDEVLDILRNTPEWVVQAGRVVDGRKRRLGMLHGGRAWWYMYEHFFPELRGADVRVMCRIEPLSEPETPPLRTPDSVAGAGSPCETAPASCCRCCRCCRDTLGPFAHDTALPDVAQPFDSGTAGRSSRAAFCMALKTNLLYDAALIPNIGGEFYLGRGWSLGGNWMYGWWRSDKRHDYWRMYGGELDVRKYFGRRASEKPLTGHHLGLYGQIFTYDFETGGRGYMGGKPGGTLWDRMNYAAGLEYGYSLPVGRRLNLDFTVGVGYWGGEYQIYLPKDDHYVWTETRQRHWFGPTKAEISLVWLLGRGFNNDMKGGKR